MVPKWLHYVTEAVQTVASWKNQLSEKSNRKIGDQNKKICKKY